MTFSLQFLICNIFISIFLCFLLLIKKAAGRRITPGGQYRLWHVFRFALIIPFLPCGVPVQSSLLLRIKALFFPGTSAPASSGAEPLNMTLSRSVSRIKDFSMAVSSAGPLLTQIFSIVWIAGILIGLLFLIYSAIRIRLLLKNARPVTEAAEPELWRQYSHCLQKLHIRKRIPLYTSCRLKSPVSCGWILPGILIPQDMDLCLSEEEISFVFLHELQHYRQRDALFNGIDCLLHVLYWFHPLIWYAFRQLRRDREIACDHAVLSIAGGEQRAKYGRTILKYAENMQGGAFFSTVSGLGGSRTAIRQRIVEIADYRQDTAARRIKSTLVFLFALFCVFCASPLFAARTFAEAPFDLEDGHYRELELSSFFRNMEGSFVLYDMDEDRFSIYNKELCTLRLSPDSTFKIYSALFSLEENFISPEASLQTWDGTPQPFAVWEQDQTLASAMRNSVNWYFQDLDRSLGLPLLASYYHRISYGNCDLSGGTDTYWAESSLKISPLEQVRLLRNLLQYEWGFQEENISAVRDALFIADLPAGRLYGKTGTGSVDGKNVNGWFVGFIEASEKTYCFSTNLHGPEDCTGSAAMEITMEILDFSLFKK